VKPRAIERSERLLLLTFIPVKKRTPPRKVPRRCWRYPAVTSEQQYREEAERLRVMPLQTQVDLVTVYMAKASNRKLPKAHREESR
jgi:hypothetical protein